MRVAFDLDNTLIRCGYEFPLETPKRQLWARLLGSERLRQGIIEISSYCRQHNWEIWVYTTSYRSSGYIRKLFWLHGMRLAGVVNQPRHNRTVTVHCTKYPPSFGIDLLIDDSKGVRREGERYGFQTVIVQPQDKDWVLKVLSSLNKTETIGNS